jgi:hypothetical protein
MELAFMEKGILINLLEDALKKGKDSIIFPEHRYTKENIEYVQQINK